MGVVYRARDAALGREVAVKTVQAEFAADPALARRFVDEARITGQLQHPNIPPVHELGTLPDGRPFLAMKVIKGRTLAGLLRGRPDPGHDLGRFLGAFLQVCHAVGYAHAHGVIHRDLKPGNVMVGGLGEVQVMDWGLAKVLSDREPQRPGARAMTSPRARSGRSGGQISGNLSGSDGGGLYVDAAGDTVTLSEVSVTDNASGGKGGRAYVLKGTLGGSLTALTGNSATGGIPGIAFKANQAAAPITVPQNQQTVQQDP